MGTTEDFPERSQSAGHKIGLIEAALQDYAVIGIDRGRRIVQWNKGAELTFGYREPEALGQPLEIIYTPEDVAANASSREFEAAIRYGVSQDERWHLRKDGSRIWTSGTLRAMWSEQGDLEGFSKIVRDTTIQKLAEFQRESLLRQEQWARETAESSWKQLAELFENLPALISLVRLPDQTYVYANRMLREYTREQDLIGRNVREAHPQLGEPYFRIIDTVASTGRPYTATEYQIPRRPGFEREDNPYFNLVLQPRHSETGEFEAILIFAADVTSLVKGRQESERLTAALQAEVAERKRAEELARRQAETLSEQAALLDLAEDAICVSRLDGTITFWNRGAEQSFGWSKEEALGKNIHQLLHTESDIPVEEIVNAVISQGHWSGEIHHTRRDGDVLFDSSRWVLRKEDGKASGWLEIDRDVTQLRRIQSLLMARQQVESLGVLAGGVAHDFNNLLTGIVGNIALAREIALPDARVDELLARSEVSCERAADLVKQMLAYAGKGQFIVGPVDVSQAAHEIMPLLRSAIGEQIHIQLELAEGMPPIQADATQVKQVATNLILNAAESIEGEGVIQVRTRIEEIVAGAPGTEEPWDVGQPESGTYVALEVRDTGSGIDPDIRTKIFEPFFSTKFAGRGLGLAAVAGIVRSLKGAAAVSSRPGQGTTITVLLPVQVRCEKQAG